MARARTGATEHRWTRTDEHPAGKAGGGFVRSRGGFLRGRPRLAGRLFRSGGVVVVQVRCVVDGRPRGS
jgi:hypothetical protein